jgi:hypothetical protein
MDLDRVGREVRANSLESNSGGNNQHFVDVLIVLSRFFLLFFLCVL